MAARKAKTMTIELLAAIVGIVLGIIGTGFGLTSARKDRVETILAVLNEMEEQYDKLKAHHAELEARYDKLEADYQKLKADYDALKAQYDKLQNEGRYL